MGRHTNENLSKAFVMADNGMDFLSAWRPFPPDAGQGLTPEDRL